MIKPTQRGGAATAIALVVFSQLAAVVPLTQNVARRMLRPKSRRSCLSEPNFIRCRKASVDREIPIVDFL
jgi:ABC-type taurine transport system ATPase subunit